MTVRPSERDPMPAHATAGIFQSGRRMLAILVSMVRTRLKLLAVEIVQEERRIWLMLALTGLVLVFVSLALLAMSLLVVVAFWDENRLLTIGCLSLFYVVAALTALIVLRQKAKHGSNLLSGILSELSKDSAALAGEFEAENMDFIARRWSARE
jgi:uncharacterized membrane protein YqjE